jgi:hypothetical protein
MTEDARIWAGQKARAGRVLVRRGRKWKLRSPDEQQEVAEARKRLEALFAALVTPADRPRP